MRVDEHTINLDESPVFYRRATEAPGVPTLYLHGIPTSSDDWTPFLAQTGGIAPDLIGFGRSGKGGHLDYSVAGITQFVERFLAEVQVEAVKLVAHDWGVAVGLAIAERHPERVERLVLCNAPPLGGGFEWPRLIKIWRTFPLGEALMGSTTRGMLARALRHGSVREDAWTDARVQEVWEQFDQGTQRAILRLVRSAAQNSLGSSGAAGSQAAGSQAAARVERSAEGPPTLIIWGERDPWYPPALADAYAARLPGATVERIPDAGHWPWLDHDDLVDRIATFLEE